MTQSTEVSINSKPSYQGTSKEVSDFIYEKSEVPQELIDECENLSLENNETYFIFDSNVSNLVKSRYTISKEEKREVELDNILGSEKYHIGTSIHFREMPSRFSYYDTETKEIDRYKKYQIVVDFIQRLGFTPVNEFNFGPEYDQSYLLNIEGKSFITRLKPNLFLSIQEGFLDNGGTNYIFEGFFSRYKIMDSLRKSTKNFDQMIRDIKLEKLID